MVLLDPSPLLRAAAVVRNGGDVLDPGDLDASRGERTERGLPPRAGPAHEHVDAAHPVLHGTLRALLGGHLSRVRRRLATALEPDVARRGPGEDVALVVGD